MNKPIPYPSGIDFNTFRKDNLSSEPYYRLPKNVVFCKKCVISNQRPNSTVEYNHTTNSLKETIRFDENGVCDACIFAKRKKNEIDWEDRNKQLQELCDRHRKSDVSYDCIVPGSGGKSSFYASYILKTKYGMNPLTVTWAPHVYTHWGWNSLQLSKSSINWAGALLQDNKPGDSAYFVHSFMAEPAEQANRIAVTNYGGHKITAVIIKDQITGCQFHPEKSREVGLKILKRFLLQ